MRASSVLSIMVLATVMAAATAPATAASLTRVLSVQGALTTSAGSPASGAYAMTLRLFPVEEGGMAAWSQSYSSVTVDGGVFDVELGPLPEGVLEAASALWLEIEVEGEALPRRPLRPVAYALVAEHANTAAVAEGVSCAGCVDGTDVDFAWAASDTKGGGASEVSCTGCVNAVNVAAGAVGTAHLQTNAVTSDKVSFNYAASGTKGGPASDVACTGCVGGGDIEANVGLAGDVTVSGALRRRPKIS